MASWVAAMGDGREWLIRQHGPQEAGLGLRGENRGSRTGDHWSLPLVLFRFINSGPF